MEVRLETHRLWLEIAYQSQSDVFLRPITRLLATMACTVLCDFFRIRLSSLKAKYFWRGKYAIISVIVSEQDFDVRALNEANDGSTREIDGLVQTGLRSVGIERLDDGSIEVIIAFNGEQQNETASSESH
ncbi:MAG: hypothetical protein HC888_00620 [Candidatus Competibacteraceae bacterium]|nr:hypothetical protein [Candidatus Competibacteraceae bacterium]